MSLNPNKCEVLSVTNKRKNIIQSQYTIHGTVCRQNQIPRGDHPEQTELEGMEAPHQQHLQEG